MLDFISYVEAITPTAPYYIHPMHGHFYVLGPGVIQGVDYDSREAAEQAALAMHDAYRHGSFIRDEGHA